MKGYDVEHANAAEAPAALEEDFRITGERKRGVLLMGFKERELGKQKRGLCFEVFVCEFSGGVSET